MKTYTGWQWLLIDAATQFGLDKLTFEKRIEWAESNLPQLEQLTQNAETKPLYAKAVLAIRKAQQGKPTGHLVGVDATCSGIQVMSALTGCIAGADATGLVDPDRRADAYTTITDVMNQELNGAVQISRKDAKRATMTSFYGSKATPKEIFGEDTPELKAFYAAAVKVAPGAWDLLQTLMGAWNSYALVHSWKLPDGFDARVKVMVKQSVRIEVDELDHASFTYEFYENQGTKKGISLAANVTHSCDAFILREMHRRCNYDSGLVKEAYALILAELGIRNPSTQAMPLEPGKLAYYIEQIQRSSLISAVIIPHINENNVSRIPTDILEGLVKLMEGMLQYKPFHLVTIHDEFKSLCGNVNWVRWNYKEILAEIADSDLLDDLLNQIHGYPGTFPKLSFNLGDKIRNSNYGLC